MARDNLANFTQAEPIADPKTGNPTTTFLQKINAMLKGLRNLGGDFDGVLTQTISGHWLIPAPEDKSYVVIQKAAYAFTITEVTTITASGSCTVTVEINGTPLGGTVNSATTSEQSQAHASANEVAAGDTLEIVVSSNSSAEDLTVDIAGTRDLAAS
jgi:hypothetical protein